MPVSEIIVRMCVFINLNSTPLFSEVKNKKHLDFPHSDAVFCGNTECSNVRRDTRHSSMS